jgi:hypothetical protein
MNESANLQNLLKDTDEQIKRLMQASARRPPNKADELNLMSLRKRRERLVEQIEKQPQISIVVQGALSKISSVVAAIMSLVGVRDKTH